MDERRAWRAGRDEAHDRLVARRGTVGEIRGLERRAVLTEPLQSPRAPTRRTGRRSGVRRGGRRRASCGAATTRPRRGRSPRAGSAPSARCRHGSGRAPGRPRRTPPGPAPRRVSRRVRRPARSRVTAVGRAAGHGAASAEPSARDENPTIRSGPSGSRSRPCGCAAEAASAAPALRPTGVQPPEALVVVLVAGALLLPPALRTETLGRLMRVGRAAAEPWTLATSVASSSSRAWYPAMSWPTAA